jgi:hypothetical protein
MTSTAVVPLVEAPETIRPASPHEASGCVILAAACKAPSSEIARRITETLADIATNITGLASHEAIPHLRRRNAVFLISSTDWPSLKLARKRAAWLRIHGLDDRCGLVLWHVPGGATAELAEDYTGLPVCALLNREEHIHKFATWVAAEHRAAAAC